MVISLILGVITGFYQWKYSLILFVGLVFMLAVVWAVGYACGLFSVSKYQVIILGICLVFWGLGAYRCRYVSKIYEMYDKLQYGLEEGIDENVNYKKYDMAEKEEILKKGALGNEGLWKYNENLQLEFQGEVTEIKKNTYGYSIVLKIEKGEVYVYADDTLCGMLDDAENVLAEQGMWDRKSAQGKSEDEVYESLYGENICVVGDVIPMKRARNYGNYDEYIALRSKGVLLKISAEAIVKSSDDKKNSFGSSTNGDDKRTLTIKGLIAKTKVSLRNVLQNIATEEEYGILAAMVLGESDEIDKEIKELYSISGISHIMAISGLHISLIGMGIYKLLRKKLRYISASSVSLGIMSFFLIFIGNPISATRAVIMFFIHIIADLCGRKYDVLSALSFAAVFLLIDNPYYLLNTSFQLSFVAMIAVCACVPVVMDFVFSGKEDNTDEKLRSLSKKKDFEIKVWVKELNLKLAKLLVFNIALSIVLMPINSFLFFRHSTYSPIVNMIVVPLVGFVLIMTLIGMFIAIIMPGVGGFFVGTAIYLLRFFTWLSEGVVRLPYSSMVTGKLSLFEVVLCYVILGVVLILMCVYRARCGVLDVRNMKQSNYENKRKMKLNIYEKGKKLIFQDDYKQMEGAGQKIIFCGKNKKDCVNLRITKIKVCICLGVLISIYVFIIFRNKYDGFSICFLDVGQGASIYIKSDTGNDYLIDGGSSDEKNIGEYKLESFLEARQVSTLEYIFITHCDTDHISGIVELIERGNILIDKLVLPNIALEARDEKYLKLVTMAKERGIEALYMKAGDMLWDGELKLTCINPREMSLEKDRSDRALAKRDRAKLLNENTDINESSLVLVAEYKGVIGIFTGDIGKETEKSLLETLEQFDFKGKLVVYDVAHHGSKNSNSQEMIDALKPRIAVVSCSKENSYGHPAVEVLERLSQVYCNVWCTYESGQVEVYESEKGMMVRGYVKK